MRLLDSDGLMASEKNIIRLKRSPLHREYWIADRLVDQQRLSIIGCASVAITEATMDIVLTAASRQGYTLETQNKTGPTGLFRGDTRRKNIMFRATGDWRRPKRGDWYLGDDLLSGKSTVFKAGKLLPYNHWIMEPVIVIQKECAHCQGTGMEAVIKYV